MNFQWRDGFHAPKGVKAEDIHAAIVKLSEPSPEELYNASKKKTHVLHEAVWAEGDQVWATRGRIDYCRRIIGAVVETIVVGNRSIETRAVEFVRTNGDGRWMSIESIRSDPDLLDAYIGEIQRLQDQATAKMAKLRELMKA